MQIAHAGRWLATDEDVHPGHHRTDDAEVHGHVAVAGGLSAGALFNLTGDLRDHLPRLDKDA